MTFQRKLIVFSLLVSINLCHVNGVKDVKKSAHFDQLTAQIHPKVELHVHFEGMVKHTTAYELLKKKNLPLVGDGTQQSFLKVIKDLPLKETYLLILSSIRGDLKALERVAYELCQIQSEGGIIYTEVHYVPHYFMPESFHNASAAHAKQHSRYNKEISVQDIVEAINTGLDMGQREFQVAVRSVLSLVRTKPEWSQHILDLAISESDKGVVGIDIAGDILGITSVPNEGEIKNETLMFQKEHIEVFEWAARYGVKRTVHAGFLGPAEMVWQAVHLLKANRIGHGYRILEDEKLYKQAIELGVHFEGSPSTAATIASGVNNPLVRFAKDGASFSASSDIPTSTKTSVNAEYQLLFEGGVTVEQMKQSNINAVLNSFAEPKIKRKIFEILQNSYYTQ